MSESSYQILGDLGDYRFQERGQVELKVRNTYHAHGVKLKKNLRGWYFAATVCCSQVSEGDIC